MIGENIGRAIGGPADGQIISAMTTLVNVPVKCGSDNGPGDRGFGVALYEFSNGAWHHKDDK
jgi:hypothetical protein